ncbi:MAG: hypothetical protein MZV70_44860 [Desulfobacterales bacterium]|nr:hypothetical protein [Desulfobacterales bacterium]
MHISKNEDSDYSTTNQGETPWRTTRKDSRREPYRIRLHLPEGAGDEPVRGAIKTVLGGQAWLVKPDQKAKVGSALRLDAGRRREIQELHQLLRLCHLHVRSGHG